MHPMHKTRHFARVESANGAVVSAPGKIITDSNLNRWALKLMPPNGYEVTKNGNVDTSTHNVSRLAYIDHSLYYEVASDNWYEWATASWVSVDDPFGASTGTIPDGTNSPGLVVPAQAAAAGYITATFSDDFNDPNNISIDNTGKANWYTYNGFDPTNWEGNNLTSADYTISNGELVLKTAHNWEGLNTINSKNPAVSTPTSHAVNAGSGLAFLYGYFEASIKFDPSAGANGPASNAWPAFWMNAVSSLAGVKPYAELDVMEAYPTPGNNPPVSMVGTVHQWSGDNSTSYQNAGNSFPATLNLSDFNTYGLLWTPASLTWYVNDQKMHKVDLNIPTPSVITTTGQSDGDQVFSAVNSSPQYLQLSTGVNQKTEVNWVHVFQ
jgi:beta-glucanase (GH16 family)